VKTRGSRRTEQREEILRQLDGADGFKTAQQLHRALVDRGAEVGLATVYRTLQALVARGEVDVLASETGESMYRRCATDSHHHHLVCRSCGRSVELSSVEVERWAARIARKHRFSGVSHVAEIFGVCERCTSSV
jgi:Fur family ferric uptake transcriptional regulator